MKTTRLLLVVVLLAGCATTPPQPVAPVPAVSQAGHGWWYVAFEFAWPQGQPPAWHRGVMVAHRVVAPVLSSHRGDIVLWRIHRRAAHDGVGHRFSFIFYSSPVTAQKVNAEIAADTDLSVWRKAGLIKKVHFDDLSWIRRPQIKDTSDPAWPKIIQETWPSYIMGVSEMWLELVTRLGAEYAPDSLAEEPYLKINKRLDRLWATHARHAFFHHLNAVYAYQPFWARY